MWIERVFLPSHFHRHHYHHDGPGVELSSRYRVQSYPNYLHYRTALSVLWLHTFKINRHYPGLGWTPTPWLLITHLPPFPTKPPHLGLEPASHP